MIADFSARSSLHGQGIVLDWVWKSADLPADGFRLVRFIGRYENSPECGTDLLRQDKKSDWEKELVVGQEKNADTGEIYCRLSFEDKTLAAGIHYYYTLSALAPDNTPYPVTACALSTQKYEQSGLSEQLYRLLPGILKLYDTPPGAGPLKRFLELFGLTLDQARGYADSLSDRHDILTARSDLLPHLADLTGWNLDQTLDIAGQRQELMFAPEVYRTLGTLPNLRAMINRATGWDCEFKEFARNVFLSNAPEPNRLWELWQVIVDDQGQVKTGSKPAPLHAEFGEWYEGRPASIVINGELWLFWASNRLERRQIYRQRFNAQDLIPLESPVAVTPFEPVFGSREWAADDDPAVAWDENQQTLWLFWSSNRLGNWDLWARTFKLATGVPEAGPLFRLTYHPAEDRKPTAVWFQNELWLFWQSNRRGKWEIWLQQLAVNGVWSNPQSVSPLNAQAEAPSVVTDGTTLWLAWQASASSRGGLLYRIYSGNRWGEVKPIPETAFCESPALLLHNHRLFLTYHVHQNGIAQIGSQTFDGSTWSERKMLTPHHEALMENGRPVTITTLREANKDPIVVADAQTLRVFWRSQERGRCYRSHTINPNDPLDMEALNLRGTWQDRLQYSYDPVHDQAHRDEHRYALNTIGITLQPDREGEALELRQQDRTYIDSIVREFLPAQVRALLFLSRNTSEYIYDDGQGIGEWLGEPVMTLLPWLRSWYTGLSEKDIDAKIGRTNDEKWRTAQTSS